MSGKKSIINRIRGKLPASYNTQKKWNEKQQSEIRKLQEQNEQIIQQNEWLGAIFTIMSAADCDVKEAVEIHKQILWRKEIPLKTHLIYRTWTLSHEEYEELLVELEKNKEANAIRRHENTEILAQRAGMSFEEADKFRRTLTKKGYFLREVFNEELYKMNPKDVPAKENQPLPVWAKAAPRGLSESEKKIIESEWQVSEGKYLLEYLKANNSCNCSRFEFAKYKLFNRTEAENNELLLDKDFHRLLNKYCNFSYAEKNLLNKESFNTILDDKISRRWFSANGLTFDSFLEKIKGLDDIIVKPAEGTFQGDGVEKLRVNESQEQNREAFEHIMARGDGMLVEECVKNHPDIAKVCNDSLNTIRIMTIVENGAADVLCAAIKFGNGSAADNLDKGGVVAGIDIPSGTICTNAVDHDDIVHETHPKTGTVIKGTAIPCWDKVLNTVKEAALSLGENYYIGWDIAVTDKETIEIIEGNHNPALYLLQMPFFFSNNEGIRHKFEKYLDVSGVPDFK